MDTLIEITFWNTALLGLLLLMQPVVRVLGFGARYALSNFDQRVQEGAFARRLAMVCANQVEAVTLLLPLVVIMATVSPGFPHPHIAATASVLLFARLAYVIVSLAGIPFLRSGAWVIGFAAWGYLVWIATRYAVSA